jgi:hypothetical protein
MRFLSIRLIPGRDLAKELGSKYKFSSEHEIAIQGGIRNEDILAATPIGANGRATGHNTLNPNRR